MTEPIRCVPENAIITGWDFSTGAVKCLAFDLEGNTLAEARIPTDLWTANGVAELNLMQHREITTPRVHLHQQWWEVAARQVVGRVGFQVRGAFLCAMLLCVDP